MRAAALVFAGSASMVAALPAHAATITVPGSYSTIQAAINAAAPGDVVVVAPGTYFENLNFNGKAITVQSSGGPAQTIVDGRRLAPVVTFSTGETRAAVLQGFTLRNGDAPFTVGYEGAGVHIASASPSIIGNLITGNIACGNGTGISVAFSSPLIQGNTIRNNAEHAGCSGQAGGGIYIGGAGQAVVVGNTITGNTSDFGGGIALNSAGTPTVQDNIIQNNFATYEGGGLWAINQSDVALVQNLITGNSARTGSGIYDSVPSGTQGPTAVNNTVTGNAGSTIAQVYLVGFFASSRYYNNIFSGATALTCDTSYSTSLPLFSANDVHGTATGCGTLAGNGFYDPAFVNPAAGDYHLKASSPAIDAGNSAAPFLPATDLDGRPRIQGSAVDQGVYEFPAPTPALTVTPNNNLRASADGTVSGQLASFSGGVAPYTATVTWGDGATSAGTVGNYVVTGSHAYSGEGTYTISVTVIDVRGVQATASLDVIVGDFP
jgi:parallel beta-helix repeat protein